VKHHTTLAVIVISLLALVCYMSCTVPAQPRMAFERVEDTAVDRFLSYFRRIRALPYDALQREHALQEAAFASDPSDENRLRLVLLLSLPDTNFGNNTSALKLLQDYLNTAEPQQGQFREIAALLYTYIHNNTQNSGSDARLKQLQEELSGTERQLAAEQQLSQKLQAELEAQKSLAHGLSKQLQEALSHRNRHMIVQQQLNRKLQDEKKHVKRLQEQIEKIKDIEKSLIERENTGNKGT
jgi:hypothetical protein